MLVPLYGASNMALPNLRPELAPAISLSFLRARFVKCTHRLRFSGSSCSNTHPNLRAGPGHSFAAAMLFIRRTKKLHESSFPVKRILVKRPFSSSLPPSNVVNHKVMLGQSLVMAEGCCYPMGGSGNSRT